MVNPLIPALAVLVLYILVTLFTKGEEEKFVFFFLFFLFISTFIQNAALGSFYMFMLIFWAFFKFAKIMIQGMAVTTHEEPIGEAPNQVFAGMGIGVGLFAVMGIFSGGLSGNIIGVPTFAFSPGDLFISLGPTLAATLGFIENRFISTLRSIGTIFGGPVVGIAFSALSFGLFHFVAYGGQLASLFFAITMGLIWSTLDFLGFGLLPADISHYLWNMSVSAGALGVIL